MHSSTKEEGWAELETSPLSSLGCTATGVAQMKLSMASTAKYPLVFQVLCLP